VDVTAAVGSVVLDLPATTWTRFEVEIDNWHSVGDNVNGGMRFGVLSTVRSGASDYGWGLHSISSVSGESNNYDANDTQIYMTRSATGWRFGNQPDESWSFTIEIDPGSGANPTTAPFNYPKCWWKGSGMSDAAALVTVYGGATYKGATSNQWGRMDQIQFENPGSIALGNFRLYGTE
jgi:hypothetical protein